MSPTREPVHLADLRAPMADGVELAGDAWLPGPVGDGPWPVLLQRLPYGRAVASTPVLPHPSWFARQGYAVVVLDCRGRGGSGGTFTPFVDEADDGAAAVEWAAGLPFADGTVATYGFSYQGLNQLFAAGRRPAALRAIAPMMCAPDPYEGWTWEHGLLCWPFVCFWAAQLAGHEIGSGPVPYDVTAWPRDAALGTDPPPWFTEWLAHPDGDDPYWQRRRPDVAAIDVPAFTVLGWFDEFSSGTAELVRRLGDRDGDVEVWGGPWGHMPWGGVSPTPVHEALVAFFDRVLKGVGDRPTRPVAYHPVGGGWRRAASWPPPHRQIRWRGRSDGNANSRFGDGVLEPVEGTSGRPGPASFLVVEPWVPYPGDPVAGQDESTAEDRRDVLCFTSAPLSAPLTIVGSPVVRLQITADRPTHDVVVTLVAVTDGAAGEEARAVCGSGLRWTADPAAGAGPVDHELALRPTAWVVPAGARLRLDVSGARFPCYDRNPHGPVDAPVVATLAVSAVELDVPVADEPDPTEDGAAA